MPYADVEALLVPWLSGQFVSPPVRFCTELPANFQTNLPIVQVGRIGGQDRVITLDAANVTVDVFGATRIEARELAYSVHSRLRFALPGYDFNNSRVTQVDTINAPNWVAFDDIMARRFSFTVQIYVHSPHVDA